MSKSMSYPEKIGVTRVTGVTTFIHAAYSVTPGSGYGVTGVTTHRRHRPAVTPVTPQNFVGVTRRAAYLLGVTLVTPVTPKKTGQYIENRGRP